MLLKLNVILLIFCLGHCQADWWESASFYQIYPRSFKDSNSDGIGDLNGITEKLPYLKDIGIKATWLSPIYKSPNVDFGYDISNFREIQPEYGTMAEFEAMTAKAHELGIKIIMDFVPNHSSDQHEWFDKSVNSVEGFENFYVWHPGYPDPANSTGRLAPSNWASVFGGSAWEWNDKRNAFYYHQFTVQQPDLNFREPKVQDAMKEVLRFWLDKGVDGFRIDAITHMYEIDVDADGRLPDEPVSGTTDNPDDYGYLKHMYTTDIEDTLDLVYSWRSFLDAYKTANGRDTIVIMTESYSDVNFVVRYYGNGTHEGAQMPFNFELMKQLTSASTAPQYVAAINTWLDKMPANHSANWVLGNHDGSRVASRFGLQRADVLNTLLMTLPGASVNYLGEEIGMTDICVEYPEPSKEPVLCTDPSAPHTFTRDFCRSPFQWNSGTNAGFTTGSKTWLPVASTYLTVNVDRQLNVQPTSHLKLYKALTELHKNELFVNGKLELRALSDKVLAYTRISDKAKFLILLNLGSEDVTIDAHVFTALPSKMQMQLSDTLYEKSPSITVDVNSIKLKGYQPLILFSSGSTVAVAYSLLAVVMIKGVLLI